MKKRIIIRFGLILLFSMLMWNISLYSSMSNYADSDTTIEVPLQEEIPYIRAETIDDDKLYATSIVAGQMDSIYSDRPRIEKLTISAVGDCTLGTDDNFGYRNSFTDIFNRNGNDYNYFFRNVRHIFNSDDLTIANLETTLTTATKKRAKKFRFKGDPQYTNILINSSIEAVNLANNHTYDYFNTGYEDTKSNLDNNDIAYFSNTYKILDIKGSKIGLLGYNGFGYNKKTLSNIKSSIEELRSKGCSLVFVSFHWGIEYDFYPNATQKKLARFSIDSGADLIIGHHPHVIQGIEDYKGKYIVYSLGNFCFGGNSNPRDKDSMIFRQTFYIDTNNNKLLPDTIINIIPCSISSAKQLNNYQPTPYPINSEGYDRIISRLNKYSEKLNFQYKKDTYIE